MHRIRDSFTGEKRYFIQPLIKYVLPKALIKIQQKSEGTIYHISPDIHISKEYAGDGFLDTTNNTITVPAPHSEVDYPIRVGSTFYPDRQQLWYVSSDIDSIGIGHTDITIPIRVLPETVRTFIDSYRPHVILPLLSTEVLTTTRGENVLQKSLYLPTGIIGIAAVYIFYDFKKHNILLF